MGGPTPAAKRPARKATKAAAKPASPKVVLDLDSLTKAKALPDLKLPTEPFTFLLDGQTYQLDDPRDKDWKDVFQLATNPFLLIRSCLVDADEPVENPTEREIEHARQREVLSGADAADEESDGEGDKPVTVLLIDRWTAAPQPSWKLNALYERWHEHYQIPKGGLLDAMLGKGTSTEDE